MIPRSSYPAVIALIVIVFALGLIPVALILLLFMVSAEFARAWAKNALARVEYERTLGQTRAFYGEEVDLAVQVTNRKILPLPWVEIEDDIPEVLPAVGKTLNLSGRPGWMVMKNILSLGPYERVTRRYRLHATARGDHRIGPVRLKSGDLFGFGSREKTIDTVDHLLVYPKIVPVEALGLPSRRPFGDLKARERLIEDPTRMRSVRGYEPGDPLRHVHWKATARTGTVQVKQFDPSAALDLLILLNVATFENAWQGVRPDVLETAISVAASIANHTLAEDIPTGLIVNATLPGTDQPLKIPPGSGPGQLLKVLESLARLSPFVSLSFEAIILRERRSMSWASTLVIITAFVTDAILAPLLALRRAGHPVVLILVNDDAAGAVPGMTVYHVPPYPDSLAFV